MEIMPFEKIENTTGISLIGKLCTLNDYQQLRNQITNLKIEGKHLILDLSRLTFSSSHGLGILIGMSNKLNTTDIELVLYNPREEIRSVLSVSGIDKKIKTVYTEEQLRQALKEE